MFTCLIKVISFMFKCLINELSSFQVHGECTGATFFLTVGSVSTDNLDNCALQSHLKVQVRDDQFHLDSTQNLVVKHTCKQYKNIPFTNTSPGAASYL